MGVDRGDVGGLVPPADIPSFRRSSAIPASGGSPRRADTRSAVRRVASIDLSDQRARVRKSGGVAVGGDCAPNRAESVAG